MIQTDICHYLVLIFEDIQRTLSYAQVVEVCELADMGRVCFCFLNALVVWLKVFLNVFKVCD